MTEPVEPKPEQPKPEQLGWPSAGAGGWAPPPVDGRAEPHTVFLGNAYDPPAPPPSQRRSPKGALSAAGLLLGGLLVGAVAVWAVQSQSTNAAQTGATSRLQGNSGNGLPFGVNGNGQNGQVPDGQSGNGQNGQAHNGGFGGGGLSGEERLVGTITAVGGSTVTLRVQGTTHTYTVVADTEIVRNGNRATLSDIEVGDVALVHVYPQGSKMLVERLFAGTLPGGGPGLPGFGGPDDQNGQDGSTGSTGSNGTTTTT